MAAKKTKPQPKLSTKALCRKYRSIIEELSKGKYAFPNSDFHEYCAGCGRSPYNVPQHDDGCIVVRIHSVLAIKETPTK